MKHLVTVILLLLIHILLLSSCKGEQHTEYRKEIEPWQQETIEEDITMVSSPHLYEKSSMENPRGYHIGTGDESKVYFHRGNLMTAVSNWSVTGQFGTTILEYSADGTLLSETEVPYFDYKTMTIIDVWPISDGRFVYYCLRGYNGSYENQHKTFLRIADADGTVLCETDLPEQETACLSAVYADMMGMHVSEQEDGSLRIFINAWHEAYYYDETLTLLHSVSLPDEYPNIHRESDGVYVIGQEMPNIGRIDMNIGTYESFDHEDLPIAPSMIYKAKIYYNAAGQMYCEYEKKLYRCDGNGTMTEIMRWEEGSENGYGTIWIMNDTSVYYTPVSSGVSSMVRLNIRDNDLVGERKVLTLVNLSSADDLWLSEMTARFNVQSAEYYVDLKQYSSGFVDNGDRRLKEDILSGNIPDLVISGHRLDLTTYFDKGVFLDLSQEYGSRLLSGVTQSFYHNGALYTVPLSFRVDTFVTVPDTLNEPLTWERLYEIEETLQDGEVLHNSYSAAYEIGDHIASSFYDADAKTVSFDSDAYRRRVEFMQRFTSDDLSTEYGELYCADISNNRYVLSAPYLVDAINKGTLKLFEMPIRRIEAFSALKLLFGEQGYMICGYPSDEGIGAYVFGNYFLSVGADSDCMAGCLAFAEYLLSDDVQCQETLLEKSLPVTLSAMSRTIDEHRYFYYGNTVFGAESSVGIGSNPSVSLSLAADAHSAEYDAQRAQTAHTVIEITEKDKADILHFFENFRTENTDETVAEIVKEELSAWESGARTLEETTKIIDSRVWIYLNE